MRHLQKNWLMNNRKKVTKYIEEALIYLLKQKELKDITITDIIKKAGVCRASFYRNYLSIDEIIDSILKKISLKFQNVKHDDIQSLIKNSLKVIKEEKDIFTTFYQRKLTYKIYELTYEVTLNEINKMNVLNNKYQPCFFAGASSAVMLEWIKNKFQESEDELTTLFIRSLKGYVEINE